MSYDPRNVDDLAHVEALAERVSAEWRDDPNVVQIAPGLKMQAGKARVDQLVLTFFVHEKLSEEELTERGWRFIPDEIDGVRTDVEPTQAEALASPLSTRRERFDPLVGGVAIGNGNRQWSWGTLGGMVFDNTSGVARGLTNEHVLVFTNEGKTGDPVIQPAPPRLEDFIDLDFTPDCCPIGPIFFVELGGPVSSFLAWCAVVAGVAALSDVKDPHQRGREATVPAPGETTLREPLNVKMNYPDFPIPGTPYRVKTSWEYTRITDGGSYPHQVEEVNDNPHVLEEQVLITDQSEYTPGEMVHLLAKLVSPTEKVCPAFHTIAYLVPGAESQQFRSSMVVLRPVSLTQIRILRKIFPDVEFEESAEECDDHSDLEVGTQLPKRLKRKLGTYTNLSGANPLRVVEWPGERGIAFDPSGIAIDLDQSTDCVSARVALGTGDPIIMQAFDDQGNLIGQDIASAEGIQELVIKGENIRRVTLIGGGNEAVLLELCACEDKELSTCYYYGRLVLDHNAPLGPWRTYLFAQTVNDVAEGVAPTVAAQTIGGMPVTNNFELIGEGNIPPYGEGCIFRPSEDGDFTVVSVSP